jgi:hypothetical protein
VAQFAGLTHIFATNVQVKEHFLQLTFNALSKVPSFKSLIILNSSIQLEWFQSPSFLSGFDNFQAPLRRIGIAVVYDISLDNALHFKNH